MRRGGGLRRMGTDFLTAYSHTEQNRTDQQRTWDVLFSHAENER